MGGVSEVYRASQAFIEAHRKKGDAGTVDWKSGSTERVTHYLVLSKEWTENNSLESALEPLLEAIEDRAPIESIALLDWGVRKRDGRHVIAVEID